MITHLKSAKDDERSDTLLVFLPGAYLKPDEFEREGFISAVRERHLAADSLLVDADVSYYYDQTLSERLHADVIEPQRALGYKSIWLVGISIGGHPSIAVLPGALALAESLGARGRDLLLAFGTGLEPQARIGHAVHTHHDEKGWHPTATLGIFGAAAASARLLGLDADGTATALAIACSLSSGVKANFGTMTKPLHAGECTRNGLYAALLAKEGFTACLEAFEHKHGFFEVFNGAGNYVAGKVLESWADPLEILNPGVGLKQYPCCGSTHSAIDAMLILRERHRLTPGEVAKIESITHDRALAHTDRPDPRSSLDAKFSVQYCVARALMHGDVTFEHVRREYNKDADRLSNLGMDEAERSLRGG